MNITFHLRDYLRPNGTKPYSSLIFDLQEAFNAGHTVYLYSVANQFILAGHPNSVHTTLQQRPWSDGNYWYKTPKDAMDRKNGKV